MSKPLFDPLNFTIEAGDRIGILGANGSGKSSLVAGLLGHFTGTVTGSVWMPQHLSISRVRQNYEDNRGTLTEFAEFHRLDYQELLNNLKKLGVERNVFRDPNRRYEYGGSVSVWNWQNRWQPLLSCLSGMNP